MARVLVFNSITTDGYFTDARGDMSWAHQGGDDPEWQAFVAGNASGAGGQLLFGRKTYEMMASFWPTPAARRQMPEVAEGMNAMAKVVFSRTLNEAAWQSTRLVKSDPAAEVRRMKKDGPDMVVLGSGSIVSLLTQAGLVDEYQMVVCPTILGSGRTMFEGVTQPPDLKLTSSRAFRNGKVVLTYEANR